MFRYILFLVAWLFALPAFADSGFIIDDFQSYSTGKSYINNSDWLPNNDCYPVISKNGKNQFLQSSSCYSGQSITKPIDITG
jgi:hypothetical protein